MKKSNWLIVAILLVVSIFLLALWYARLHFVDDPLDLVISIIWWLIIVTVCVLITRAEKKRRRAIRTSFLAPGLIYNPEAGIVRVEDQNYALTLQEILDNLTYGFSKEDASTDQEQHIRFTHIVRSDKFSDEGDTWEGEVVKVSNPDEELVFENRNELAALINVA